MGRMSRMNPYGPYEPVWARMGRMGRMGVWTVGFKTQNQNAKPKRTFTTQNTLSKRKTKTLGFKNVGFNNAGSEFLKRGSKATYIYSVACCFPLVCIYIYILCIYIYIIYYCHQSDMQY